MGCLLSQKLDLKQGKKTYAKDNEENEIS